MTTTTKRHALLKGGALQPFALEQFEELERRLAVGGDWEFRPFESFRSPIRQRELLIEVPPVTKADAWESAHQYGLAVDFVWWKESEDPDPMNWGWSWKAPKEAYAWLKHSAESVGLFVPWAWDPGHVVHPAWTGIQAWRRKHAKQPKLVNGPKLV